MSIAARAGSARRRGGMTKSKQVVPDGWKRRRVSETVSRVRGPARLSQAARGFDFHGYKRFALHAPDSDADEHGRDRRVCHCTQTISRFDPDEFTRLFNTILINVTSFFRDPPAWEFVASDIHPSSCLAATRPGIQSGSGARGAPRARRSIPLPWCCARRWAGRQFRERVKVYGTDVDEEALSAARQAALRQPQLESVPPDLLRQVFRPARRALRPQQGASPQVIFGRHDLIKTPPSPGSIC